MDAFLHLLQCSDFEDGQNGRLVMGIAIACVLADQQHSEFLLALHELERMEEAAEAERRAGEVLRP